MSATILSGCGSSQPAPETNVQVEESNPAADAVEYELLASQTTDDKQKAVYQYLAAQAWVEAGFEDRAYFQFLNIDTSKIEADQFLTRNLWLADFHNTRGKPSSALEYLEDRRIRLGLNLVDDELKSLWAIKTGGLNASIGRYDHAINIYDFALSFSSEQDRQLLRESLWRSLTLIDGIPKGPFLSPEMTGWVALAEINNQSTGTVSDQYLSYLLWQDQFYGHPAQSSPPASFSALADIAASDRPKVAILLPLTGPLASAGNAILDGYMTARAAEYDSQSIDPVDPLAPEEIQIYDTNAKSMYSIIKELSQGDFDLVIGPLDKARVEDYANLMPDIPTLALNDLPLDSLINPESPILGLSLNIEDEAIQAAIRARQEGHQKAMVLVPNSEWGDRAGFAFSDYWKEEGGEVLDFSSYGDNATHADLLERKLQVDQSNSRKQALQGLLGKNLEFTPRRREDIDALFLAASPSQARQLKPMLAFFFAEDIPVYSTSSIYNGNSDSKADRDLDGIQFSTLPWVLDSDNVLRQTISEVQTANATTLKLQAIGVDSFYMLIM